MQNEHCCMDLKMVGVSRFEPSAFSLTLVFLLLVPLLEHPPDSATGYTAWKAIILLLNYRCIMLQLVILRNDLTWIVTVIKLESLTAYVARNQAVYCTLCFQASHMPANLFLTDGAIVAIHLVVQGRVELP